jgi:hypothetical protein
VTQPCLVVTGQETLIAALPVVLIPLSIAGALACVARPRWLDRYGILLCLISIVGMSSIFLAMNAGSTLQGILHLTGQPAHLISEHSQAAGILAAVFVAFTAVLILTFSAERINGSQGPTGLGFADRALGAPRSAHAAGHSRGACARICLHGLPCR